MTITVRYFAGLREQVGRAEDRIEAGEASTVADAWRRLHGEALPNRVLAAVNQHYVAGDHRLADGDELAFFPPVTGG